MATDIETVTISSIVDRHIVLSNSQIARIMEFGNNWTKLRIGFRTVIEDTGANLTSSPRFWFGVMSNPVAGLTNGPLSASTSHFVGIVARGATMLRGSGDYTNLPADRYEQVDLGWGKKVGSTETITQTAHNTLFSATPSSRRPTRLLEFEKGSGTPYTMTIRFMFATNAAVSYRDHTFDELIDALEVTDFTDACTSLGWGGDTNTVSVNENTNGELNALVFAWNRSDAPMHISEVMFTKYNT